jgi:hypothetical protein
MIGFLYLWENCQKYQRKEFLSSHGNFFYCRKKLHPVRLKGFHNEKKGLRTVAPMAFLPQSPAAG